MALLKHKIIITICRMTKLTPFYLLICFLIISNTYAKRAKPPAQITIHPSKAIEAARKHQLLPKAEELTDTDALPLYEKALESLPKKLDTKKINQWRKTPLDELPQKEVQAALNQFETSLKLLKQAAECKRCEWTYEALEKLNQYRNTAFLLTLQIHFETARGNYDNAIGTVQTGFALAKNLSKEPATIPGLVAVAIAEVVTKQIEYFIQNQDAPNLYHALSELPQPFIDLSVSLEIEEADVAKKVQLLTNRLDRHLAALRCIEALRLYAGSHDGKYPEKLSDITEITIPNDPVTKKPFSYNRTGSEAVLELKGTEGSEGRDSIRYELKLEE